MIRRIVFALGAISLLSAAPMSLIDYKDARPWAKSIKAAVLQHAMPPWLADPSIAHFSNDRRLSQAEIDTLVAWVDGGTPEVNPAELGSPTR